MAAAGRSFDSVVTYGDDEESSRGPLDAPFRHGGQADAANKRITDALGTQDAGQDPGDEGDGEQAS